MAIMTIEEIMKTRKLLDFELAKALTTMERKDTIYELRMRILENQRACPHFSEKYNFAEEDGKCPYCGKIMG